MHIFDMLSMTHNDFHKGGLAAEGSQPAFVEAAHLFGRGLLWSIKCVSNMCVFVDPLSD